MHTVTHNQQKCLIHGHRCHENIICQLMAKDPYLKAPKRIQTKSQDPNKNQKEKNDPQLGIPASSASCADTMGTAGTALAFASGE